MGFGYMHYNQIVLVLNLNNLSISPQSHVVFDDGFTYLTSGPETTPTIWKDLITLPNNRLHVTMYKDDNPELTGEWLTQGEDEHRENQHFLEVMNKYRTSEEVIPDTRLNQVTRQTPVSESPNQPGILSNVKEAADSPQSYHCEVKFEEYYIGTGDEN